MDSLWDDAAAGGFGDSDLARRVYTSRLLGRNPDLVLHGGGNTSVKSSAEDIFGQRREVLYVKGSGWDLKTIEAAGFSPCDLGYLQQLATLESLTDSEMMRQLRLALLDPGAPTPSVEAILHAIIPLKYVDHTHTDAVVAVSNTPGGEERIRAIFGERVLVLPYIMPGFVLARQVYQFTRDLDWGSIQGIFLMHHGLFTFADDARESYEAMVELVSAAEAYLQQQGCWERDARGGHAAAPGDFVALAGIRQQVSALAGRPMLARWLDDDRSVGFAALGNVGDIATRGPITPDHSIHTKPRPAVLGDAWGRDLERFREEYQAYFARLGGPGHTCLDPAPRWAVWKDRGLVSFGPNAGRVGVVGDIAAHTIKAIQWGEALGGWEALPEADLFAVEYWELEQAKLKKAGAAPEFEGRIALVTGAASGIGKACVEEFAGRGACVVALDINPAVTDMYSAAAVLGLRCDVTDDDAVRDALQRGVARFGGLDVLVSNAGVFSPSENIEAMSDANWDASLALNLTSHMQLMRAAVPFLKCGIAPAVVIIASKNVPAPGPAAGAYSCAKAGLAQLGRVAALELGGAGIRVNTVHPNAVFDTGVWDEDTLARRAGHYGLTVEQYKQNNVLRMEVKSTDVARLVRSLAGRDFVATTGAAVPVDGGNDRVI